MQINKAEQYYTKKYETLEAKKQFKRIFDSAKTTEKLRYPFRQLNDIDNRCYFPFQNDILLKRIFYKKIQIKTKIISKAKKNESYNKIISADVLD